MPSITSLTLEYEGGDAGMAGRPGTACPAWLTFLNWALTLEPCDPVEENTRGKTRWSMLEAEERIEGTSTSMSGNRIHASSHRLNRLPRFA
jgi:hypothetical protein